LENLDEANPSFVSGATVLMMITLTASFPAQTHVSAAAFQREHGRGGLHWDDPETVGPISLSAHLGKYRQPNEHGLVHAVYGSSDGLAVPGNRTWNQNGTGVGTNESGDVAGRWLHDRLRGSRCSAVSEFIARGAGVADLDRSAEAEDRRSVAGAPCVPDRAARRSCRPCRSSLFT
jgi:hypothetical protein